MNKNNFHSQIKKSGYSTVVRATICFTLKNDAICSMRSEMNPPKKPMASHRYILAMLVCLFDLVVGEYLRLFCGSVSREAFTAPQSWSILLLKIYI